MSESAGGIGGGFSFKFTKKIENKVKVNPANKSLETGDGNYLDNERSDFVHAIDGKEIQSSAPVVKKGELVIPLIKNNNWRVSKLSKKQQELDEKTDIVIKSEDSASSSATANETTSVTIKVKNEFEATPTPVLDVKPSLEELAKQELIAECKRENEEWDNRSSRANSTRVIPILMRNAVPTGFEEDEHFDVSARAEDPTSEDYERVPVEEFGLAMLRGMGWKPGEAVGGKMKQVVVPMEVTIRPKGLGLGAEIPMKKQKLDNSKSGNKNANHEELELKKGCRVSIEMGEYKGFYGLIEAFDEDLVRATVRLVLTDMVVFIPVAALRLVTKDEYTKDGKTINKSSYDEYKKKETKSSSKDSRDDKHSSRDEKDKGRLHKTNDRKNESNSTRSSTNGSGSASSSSRTWLMPYLHVRFVDKNYKRGKFYKEKMSITEVLTPKTCVCKTDDKKYLVDIKAGMLETVIPKSDRSKVMILHGDHKGEIGRIVTRNNDKCTASVQLLSDRSEIVKLDYDDICEYLGTADD